MLLFDLIAASANEGLSWEMFRRYLPKTAAQELNHTAATFGRLYFEMIWDERMKEAVKPSSRYPFAWPIRKAADNIVPFRGKTVSMDSPGF